MNCKPYIPQSERSELLWNDLEAFTGIHQVYLREARWEYIGCELSDFADAIKHGEIKKEKLHYTLLSDGELAKKAASFKSALLDSNFTRRPTLWLRLKGTPFMSGAVTRSILFNTRFA